MDERNLRMSFEHEMLPHLDSAYNLARWLTRNEHDAQDIVQEAYIRAYRFFSNFRGGEDAALAAENRAQHVLHMAPSESEKPGLYGS